MHLFKSSSEITSRAITETYSTSFFSSVSMLDESIQQDIHNIYGFVRLADEIVDTFLDYKQEALLDQLEQDVFHALKDGISINPVVHAFQLTVNAYKIDHDLIKAFMHSMRMDLTKKEYTSMEEYKTYIYGSADVVGLMCLKVFVNGDEAMYQDLKPTAMRLGSAFQKVNFLRDIKADAEILERSYFPHIDLQALTAESKQLIIDEIEADFDVAYEGIVQLPHTARFGVYTAYKYYRQLLKKLKRTPSDKIMDARIRVGDPVKYALLLQSYLTIKLNIL